MSLRGTNSAIPAIVGPTWEATKFYNASSGGLVDVLDDTKITFEMGTSVQNKFGGSAGCNSYFGSYSWYDMEKKSSFIVDGPIGSTLMACFPDEVMEQEFVYLSNFEEERVFDWFVLDDGSLILKEADTDTVLATYTEGARASATQ